MSLNALKTEGNYTPKKQTPYAIAKLGESARAIRQAINELPALRKRLERNREVKAKAREIYNDMQNQHRKLLGALDTAALSLLEAEQDDMANHSVKLGQSIKSFNLMTPDYTKLCAVFNNYLSRLPLADPSEVNIIDGIDTDTKDASAVQTTNNRIIGRLMNNVRMGYYPTCTDNLAHITRGMDFPENVTINLLDPCCGCGIALSSMGEVIASNGVNCKTYGIELDSYRAEEALTRVDRVGFGSFYHSRISNEAFHAMLLNPPYLSLMTEGGNNTRSERLFLVDSISNLMIGGLLVYIIPYYRLTADIARILCENFSDLSIWKFTGAEFKRFKQVAILGTRIKRRNCSETYSELASMVLNPSMLPELSELPAGRYQLPNINKEVALFKGALFNENELSEQLSKSKSFSRVFQRSALDSATKRPLLPLSLGQIGLVGGSGLINGLVECETPHIIKGRVIKEKRTRMEANENSRGDLISTTQTETISNKLTFNLLTPAGFISLTDHGGDGSIEDFDDAPGDDTTSRLGRSGSRFPLGRRVITSGARASLTDDDIYNALCRHEAGDWGTVTKKDWTLNNNAIKNGERVVSSYLASNGEKFWIITECDRSYTTVLMPDEY